MEDVMKNNVTMKNEIRKFFPVKGGMTMWKIICRGSFALLFLMAFWFFVSGCGKSENAVVGLASNNPTVSGSSFESKAPEEIADNADADLQADATYKTTFSDGTDIAASGAAFLDMKTCSGSSCHKTIYDTFVQTNHGTAWTRKVSTFDSYAGKYKYCVNCHTVNGNFYDLNNDHKYTAGTDKEKFGIAPKDYQSEIDATTNKPSVLFDSKTGKYKEYAGIQCENCHGPASLHTDSSGNRKDTATALKILRGKTSTLSYGGPAGNAVICGSCHSQFKEWRKSMHSIATLVKDNNPAEHAVEYITGTGTTKTGSCASCHASEGFITAIAAGYEPKDYTSNPVDKGYSNISCVTCHDPHKKTGNDAQLRVSADELCMKCHNQRYGAGAYIGAASGQGGNVRLVHQPVREMYLGGTGRVGESAYDSSGNLMSVGKGMGGAPSCVSCHMYSKTDRAAGIEWLGHTFNPRVEACQECHSGMDAKTVIQLKQTQWKKTYEELDTKLTALKDKFEKQIQSDKNDATYSLIPSGYTAKRCGKPIKDGYTEYSAWAKKCAYAEFNLWFSEEAKSEGVHNAPYQEKIFTETEKLITWLDANAMK